MRVGHAEAPDLHRSDHRNADAHGGSYEAGGEHSRVHAAMWRRRLRRLRRQVGSLGVLAQSLIAIEVGPEMALARFHHSDRPLKAASGFRSSGGRIPAFTPFASLHHHQHTWHGMTAWDEFLG